VILISAIILVIYSLSPYTIDYSIRNTHLLSTVVRDSMSLALYTSG